MVPTTTTKSVTVVVVIIITHHREELNLAVSFEFVSGPNKNWTMERPRYGHWWRCKPRTRTEVVVVMMVDVIKNGNDLIRKRNCKIISASKRGNRLCYHPTHCRRNSPSGYKKRRNNKLWKSVMNFDDFGWKPNWHGNNRNRWFAKCKHR